MSKDLHPYHNRADKICCRHYGQKSHLSHTFDRHGSWQKTEAKSVNNIGIIGKLNMHKWLTLSQSSFCSVKALRNSCRMPGLCTTSISFLLSFDGLAIPQEIRPFLCFPKPA